MNIFKKFRARVGSTIRRAVVRVAGRLSGLTRNQRRAVGNTFLALFVAAVVGIVGLLAGPSVGFSTAGLAGRIMALSFAAAALGYLGVRFNR